MVTVEQIDVELKNPGIRSSEVNDLHYLRRHLTNPPMHETPGYIRDLKMAQNRQGQRRYKRRHANEVMPSRSAGVRVGEVLVLPGGRTATVTAVELLQGEQWFVDVTTDTGTLETLSASATDLRVWERVKPVGPASVDTGALDGVYHAVHDFLDLLDGQLLAVEGASPDAVRTIRLAESVLVDVLENLPPSS